MTIEQLGIDQLPIADRLRLAQEILDHVAAEQSRPHLTEAKWAELRRRIAEVDADPTAVTPWEEVEARLLARFQKS